MNRSIVARLIAKDLYLYRWLMGGGLAAGIASLVISRFSAGDNVNTGVNIGFLLFVTTVIAFGIFIAMLGILKERSDKSQLFVLSLPVSPAQYWAAKVWAALIAFGGPWLALTASVVLAVALTGAPAGDMPFFLAMMGFFLGNFCLLTAVIVITTSELWAVAAILVTNVSVTVFFSKVSALPGVAGRSHDAAATWSPEILTVLAFELALIVLSLALALYLPSRKKDFV
jgi:hypothetical protein